jgi:hypothetical protein
MSSKARLVITAITVENRPIAEVVAQYSVSRSWLYELLAPAWDPSLTSHIDGRCPVGVSIG